MTGAARPSSSPNRSIIVVPNISAERKTRLGINSWPKRSYLQGKFSCKFPDQEIWYLLKGKVKACIEGSSECVEFSAGDLVTFRKGISCTGDVSVAVEYRIDSSSSSSSSSS